MASVFSQITAVPEDEAFGIIRHAKADKDPNTVMLSAGVYRDDNGNPWTLPTVVKARSILLNEANLSYDYLPISGDFGFLQGARRIALGTKHSPDPCITSVQTVAGTGANHIGALLLADVIKPGQVWFSDPTWVNHRLIWHKASKHIQQREYPYWNADTNSFDFEAMIACLDVASQPGDVVVLQACAHNPTGMDPSKEQWQAIADLCRRRKLFPFFDAAYLGFASGNLEEDGWAIRYFLDLDDLELCIAQSFSKNFGLYSERVGALHVKTYNSKAAGCTKSLLEQLTRSEISQPPANGARIVAKIVNDDKMFESWMVDLQTMSSRLRDMRESLHSELVRLNTPGNWEHILKQVGMFSYMGITTDQAIRLRKEYHIYLLDTGRVSITGCTKANIGYVAASIDATLRND